MTTPQDFLNAQLINPAGGTYPFTVNDVLVQAYGSGLANDLAPGGATYPNRFTNIDNAIAALTAAHSTDEAALLAAIQGVTAGTVNVTELAQALVPLLAPADAAAFQTALATALSK